MNNDECFYIGLQKSLRKAALVLNNAGVRLMTERSFKAAHKTIQASTFLMKSSFQSDLLSFVQCNKSLHRALQLADQCSSLSSQISYRSLSEQHSCGPDESKGPECDPIYGYSIVNITIPVFHTLVNSHGLTPVAVLDETFATLDRNVDVDSCVILYNFSVVTSVIHHMKGTCYERDNLENVIHLIQLSSTILEIFDQKVGFDTPPLVLEILLLRQTISIMCLSGAYDAIHCYMDRLVKLEMTEAVISCAQSCSILAAAAA